MKIIFMGTPDFAVPTLKKLYDSGYEVQAVFTQPDKPKGRGYKLTPPPVKVLAQEHDTPVYQPQSLKKDGEEYVKIINDLAPDCIVVAAYGKMLPKSVLDIPRLGCVNVHGSLLPKYRGAAPIQQAVIDGEKESGVTIMQMDKGLDTGDILLVEKYRLAPKETGGSLFDKLSELGGPLLLKALDLAEKGELSPVPQKHEKHTYAKMLTKALGEIDFTQSAEVIERLIRGLNPWPSAYTHLAGKMLKIWDADVVPSETKGEPGRIVQVEKDSFMVQTGKDLLKINSLQLEGKKRMDAESFLRGYTLEVGSTLS